MNESSNNAYSLRTGEESPWNNSINKRQPVVEKFIPIKIIPTESDDFLHISLQSPAKKQKVNKNKILTLDKKPTNRIRSQSSGGSTNYNLERYHHHYRHHHSHYPRHEEQRQQAQQPAQPLDQCDMRLFIIRHGERVDRYFGSNWFMSAFDQFGQYRPYHMNLPPDLPHRLNPYFWALDTPLTRDGLNAAENVGRVLEMNKYQPSYVYSSPAMRCIFTTYQILKGLGLERKLSIRIEPGLLELGAARFGMHIFLKSIDWYNYGINVDLSYQPIMSTVPSVEREDEYYLRSKYVVRKIEQRHENGESSLDNILIVAHATSPDTLTWDLVGRQPNVYDLFALSLNIGYLQMVITERKKQNKLWSLTQIPLQSATIKWV
ncbi:unnamed protein product [Rotaria magnacalcarata]|uniref:Uncharacterized protein n=2 Tax=Rotaria magnacalcarata TaxID=392030 RepID=A0A819NUJ2_9BILA|nr:unnamed protein product [Rotaria magnacalcarata]CAF4002164.1 unnamed protein product [Rotaria magnacalcarata]